MAFEDFVEHFWSLVPQLLARTDLDDAALSRAIAQKAHLEGFQAGKTKVRMHEGFVTASAFVDAAVLFSASSLGRLTSALSTCRSS